MMDREGLIANGPINIVIFGDSVSHGAVVDNIDYENVYWNQLKKKLNAVRSYVPVNMINSSIGGTTAKMGVPRIERDILSHHPDLVIVCFGLNDVNGSLEDYIASLKSIFSACLENGIDTILLTPNMLNTYVAEDTAPRHLAYAEKTARIQNEGRMDLFVESGAKLAREMGVAVCDCYAKWKEIAKTKDTTLLLANRINHPVPHMHSLFADALYDEIMGEGRMKKGNDSTMY